MRVKMGLFSGIWMVGATVAVLLVPGWINAAGFDCGQIRTVTEKIVCGDERLSAMDEALNALYRVLRHADSVEQGALKTGQLEWLKLRDRCEAVACLVDAYRDRIREFEARVASLKDGWGQSLTGVYFRTDGLRFVRVLHFPDETIRFRFLDSPDDPGVFGFPANENALTGKVDLASASGVFRSRDCKLVFTVDEGRLHIVRDDEKGDCGLSEDWEDVAGTYVRKRPGLAVVEGATEP
ncbi:MAG: lysozyme inhibitor LprI family protein [Desulfococcaceae bacterium]